ncbi:hypothetical protein PCL_10224 [Purpureocillium lilacinum]|uniref:Uncharacterized protein n=1 Tax=Purpureocillium lilacinum TaxID=33203 RepID=A0A2U3EFB5_PURLI|nr:hypothetical protein PCL_10224 [Purpureocillium lilacinum]
MPGPAARATPPPPPPPPLPSHPSFTYTTIVAFHRFRAFDFDESYDSDPTPSLLFWLARAAPTRRGRRVQVARSAPAGHHDLRCQCITGTTVGMSWWWS